jgi:hypothetical protein
MGLRGASVRAKHVPTAIGAEGEVGHDPLRMFRAKSAEAVDSGWVGENGRAKSEGKAQKRVGFCRFSAAGGALSGFEL